MTPDAAFLRHGDGEARLGHRVHGGRDDRDIEADGAGDLRCDVRLAGHDLGGGGHEQDIVERQRDGGIDSERAMGPCGHAFAVS